MTTMLWFCDDKKPLEERIERAAAFYQTKYGRRPTHCLVPSGETEIPTVAGPISVESRPGVLPNHMHIGGDS